jgi:hypothetical protein
MQHMYAYGHVSSALAAECPLQAAQKGLLNSTGAAAPLITSHVLELIL